MFRRTEMTHWIPPWTHADRARTEIKSKSQGLYKKTSRSLTTSALGNVRPPGMEVICTLRVVA